MTHVAIIGAGIGGLAAALRLSHAGLKVSVFERHQGPGGKMRTMASSAGPIDAGPTVLTLKPVFEALFADVGLHLSDHVTLTSEPILARHFWSDGTTLDLMQDEAESYRNVARSFGAAAATEFTAFCARTRLLFDTFEDPMIRAATPSALNVTAKVLRNPTLIPAMAPHRSLASSLNRQFSDARLAQLFARYATYVGGLPAASPALLGLIWQAERRGVWHVQGGMHQLAVSIATCAQGFGATVHYGAHVTKIETQQGRACAVRTDTGRVPVDAVLFNGDPMALTEGRLGPAATTCLPTSASAPRSLSASVLSFAADVGDIPLAAHNVFFADDPAREYAPLAQGDAQTDPTLYVCAQDRFGGQVPCGPERFEIILNSPAIQSTHPENESERQQCQSLILQRLAHFGLQFSPRPGPDSLTTPQGFDRLFPASKGALYGRSPHGMMAAFKRPQARTTLKGLYLVGGGAHPGAGVPMATLSAQHAAAAILNDLSLTSTSLRADTPGGTSTGSATMATSPSPSLVS